MVRIGHTLRRRLQQPEEAAAANRGAARATPAGKLRHGLRAPGCGLGLCRRTRNSEITHDRIQWASEGMKKLSCVFLV